MSRRAELIATYKKCLKTKSKKVCGEAFIRALYYRKGSFGGTKRPARRRRSRR